MIKVNKARCKKCGDVIESKYRHDFQWCKCGAIFVDGGKVYLRRGGDPNDFEELSEEKCPHKKTVALNEEGNAGVYCSDCGEKVSGEC